MWIEAALDESVGACWDRWRVGLCHRWKSFWPFSNCQRPVTGRFDFPELMIKLLAIWDLVADWQSASSSKLLYANNRFLIWSLYVCQNFLGSRHADLQPDRMWLAITVLTIGDEQQFHKVAKIMVVICLLKTRRELYKSVVLKSTYSMNREHVWIKMGR